MDNRSAALNTRRISVLLFFVMLHTGYTVWGQKPFSEGSIDYKLKLITPDNKVFEGKFIFTIKGGQIKKEMKLNNGYRYVLLIDAMNNTVYSLQAHNGKNYAIQLTMNEIEENQSKFTGYVWKEDKTQSKQIAGYTGYKGDIIYRDGSHSEIFATREWCPEKSVTYDHFPEAKFLPLSYTYKDESGSSMILEAEKISILPVENAVFKVPSEYKIISHNEYEQLRK